MSDQSTAEVVPEWTPAFPGQRPPFTSDHPAIAQPGNERALQHGYYSERVLAPIAQRLLADVLALDECAYLRKPQWRPALTAWARAEAQVLAVTEYLEKAAEGVDGELGDLDEDRVRTAYLLLHRAEARATTGRTRLGLDPLSKARLRKDETSADVDVVELMAKVADALRAAKSGGTDEGADR